ncbi:MAG: SWIM zinc finger family protein [Pseudomonadota bacterium]
MIAWVSGTKRYATTIEIIDGEYLDSYCTCPYAINCKHGVAVVLEYLECLKKNQEVPVCRDEDERLYLLSDDLINPDIYIKDAKKNMLGFLGSCSKDELIDIIVALSRQYPEIAHDMATRHLIGTKDADGLEQSIQNDILEITQESDWGDPWQEDVFTPEISSVRDKFEGLLKAGYPDRVLTLAEELSRESNEIVERTMHGIPEACLSNGAFMRLKRLEEQMRFSLYTGMMLKNQVISEGLLKN